MKQKKNKKAGERELQQFQIPVEGSLGLLALGDVGLREWRKVRDNSEKKKDK